MRLVYFLLFTVVASVNLLQAKTTEDKTDLTSDILIKDIESLPYLWPRFVNLKQPLQISDSDKTIESNYRGILMRVEEEHAVVNFGRYGTHRINIEETNFISSMQELLDADKLKQASQFQDQMFNKFFKLEDEEFVQSVKEDIYVFDYFLLFYADLKTPESEEVVSWFLKNKEVLVNLSCSPLLMPMDSTEKELLDDIRDLGWTYPSVYHWTYQGHKKALSFDPTPNPSIILIDGSGRMISRGSNTDFLHSVGDIIKEDKKKILKIRKKYKLESDKK